MKNSYNFLLLCIFLLSTNMLEAQKRYVEPIFESVVDSTNITYGTNINILTLRDPRFLKPTPEELELDVYMPEGDTAAERPLVIYFHTGNFIPFPANRSTTGSKTDSTVVNICTRLAKMGYVAAAATYRKGWDPLDPSQTERTRTLINAAYRGVQDSRTAVRYFKHTVADEGNPFKIDTSRITMWGQGTGGYIALASSTIDGYQSIFQAADGTTLQKFIAQDTLKVMINDSTCVPVQNSIGEDSVRAVPMVLESIHGNVDGTSYGIFPQVEGVCNLDKLDTLSIPNHVEHTSDFQLVVNMGGAMGDINWLDESDLPIISFHAPYDMFAPYKTNTLRVFVSAEVQLPVVPVSGGYDIQKKAEELGLNDAFDIVYKDPYTLQASTRWESGDYLPGLFPVQGNNSSTDSSPWDYWNSDVVCAQITGYNALFQGNLVCDDIINPAVAGNPGMSRAKADLQIDTVMNFFAPRACKVLNLDCDLTDFEAAASNSNLEASQVGFLLSPNPTSSVFNLSAEKEMKDILLYATDGRLVQHHLSVEALNFRLSPNGLPNGIYIAQIRFEDGILNQKVIVQR